MSLYRPGFIYRDKKHPFIGPMPVEPLDLNVKLYEPVYAAHEAVTSSEGDILMAWDGDYVLT